ncbi:hypothetical protein L2750_09500 [Shewanella submarina]|uniref:DUF4440 domain-containing protein n=1 Tax=Shewanella submarina TaxID=2016376 RepID=A0ABV7G6S3_9GAMM|nr:hypothetical protein [Shewanella submarina]MCL1037389.1 hypothetical protein [Shewanella submarina]
MMQYLILLLAISFGAVASEFNNFDFSATDNSDPLFIEKCQIYRDALKQKDIETIKTFISPEFFSKPGFDKALQGLIRRFDKQTEKPQYSEVSKSLDKLSNPDVAGVTIRYEYKYKQGKGGGNAGCTFDRMENGNWKIRLN